ncbi:DMT family transporter [Pararhodobacter sp.]|uniref:DMT family transporter n=1 Tax=Pararhodobacter sp. TaxID=2127056 RepID=UPI002FDF55D1
MTAAPPAARLLLGIGLAVSAVFLFAAGDTLTKVLTDRHPVERIAAVRYAVGLLILLIFVAPRAGRQLWTVRRPVLVAIRALILTLATLVIGYALRLLPVGETIAIMYLAPFAVMALAVPLLGEKVTRTGWVLAALGFAGVLLIVRPGSALNPAGVGLALLLAAANTVFHLMTRVLTRTETPLALLFWVNAIGAAFFLVAALPTMDAPLPDLTDAAMMAALGAIFTLGHFLFGMAYREAPTSLIAPVNYLHFVWATLMGWSLFGHIPDAVTLAGMGLILVSGSAIAVMAHVMSRPPR